MNQDMKDESQVPSIRKLDEATINKIAAGEVVVSPSAALKEMIENSIDAGASRIDVLCQKSGFDFMQIQDNGHGIKVLDFPLLCERFATSKIEKFSDLKKVGSFGFRGEALASISYVSKLTVTSKVQDSELAYQADFVNGIMLNEDGNGPKPCAGQQGTTIVVKDLFANNPQRKKSMGVNEEYSKIVDVVTKYSVHYPMIKFSCRKMDDKKTDLSTHNIQRHPINDLEPADQEKQKNVLRIDIIKKTFGQNQAGKDFIEVVDQLDLFQYSISTIMNRLVESDKIKRTLDQVYQQFQPKGGYSYFVYMSLFIPSEQIDVNVHPTKKQVIFERQEEFVEYIQDLLIEKIAGTTGEKSFQIDAPSQRNRNNSRSNNYREEMQQTEQLPYVHTREPSEHHKKNLNAMRMVRTDATAMTLDRFLVQGSLSNNTRNSGQDKSTVVSMNIVAVRKLIHEFEQDIEPDLQDKFKKHTFVGFLTPEQVLLQFGVNLMLVQVEPLLREFLYQESLRQVQSMDKYRLFTPLSLSELLKLALDLPSTQYNPNIHLPKTIKPYPELLPSFILRLATDVDYSSQNNYYHQIAVELSYYYSSLVTQFKNHNVSYDDNGSYGLGGLGPGQNGQMQQINGVKDLKKVREEELRWQYQYKLFPQMRGNLVIRSKFGEQNNATFTYLTKVENLYKVFERC
eukprot:403351590